MCCWKLPAPLHRLQAPEAAAGPAIVTAFLQLDDKLRKLKHSAGSPAVVCFVTPEHYVVANCGDSRCVVVRGRSSDPSAALWASKDHKPSDVRADEVGWGGVEVGDAVLYAQPRFRLRF